MVFSFPVGGLSLSLWLFVH